VGVVGIEPTTCTV